MTNNLFTNLPSSLPDELFTTLLDADVRIERIVSHGHASPEEFWSQVELDRRKPGDHVPIAEPLGYESHATGRFGVGSRSQS